MLHRTILLSLFLILGCSHGLGVRPLYMENGTQVYEAQCNTTRHTIGDCKRQASETCGGNFIELGKDSRDSAAVMNGTMYPIVNRSLQFKCN